MQVTGYRDLLSRPHVEVSRARGAGGALRGRLDENKSCGAPGNHVKRTTTIIIGGFFLPFRNRSRLLGCIFHLIDINGARVFVYCSKNSRRLSGLYNRLFSESLIGIPALLYHCQGKLGETPGNSLPNPAAQSILSLSIMG